RRQHREAEHHQQQAKDALYDSPVHLHKRNANLEQAFELLDLAPIGHEQDHVVVGLDGRIVMCDEDPLVANDCDDGRT
ncbi:hypothetical protein ABE52_05325, partial [Bacillus thuringiensis]|nr:hypothetical protein [Bacillus thuringiensis]